MLFQNAALFDSLPVWRNVAFGLIEVEGMAPSKAKDEALENLAAVGLDSEVAELWPGELSGGMRKRVGLARAIATKPEILFFDEPTTGLDPIMGDVIDQLIVKSVKEVGATALSITHDMDSARRISDHIAMLYGGTHDLDRTDRGDRPQRQSFVEQFVTGSLEGPIEMQIQDHFG